MPNITVELLAGRTVDQRRAFAQAVADSAVELLGARRQDVRMVFSEITPDVVANGGVLASEDDSRAGVVAALGGGTDGTLARGETDGAPRVNSGSDAFLGKRTNARG